MTYLLDTCLLSRLRKLKNFPEPKLSKWFEAHPETEYYISTVSIGEIERGISRLPIKDPAKMILEEWFHGQLIPQFEDRILNFDKQAAIKWGKLLAESERAGYPLPILDAQIAAIAETHHLIVATLNEKDFQRFSADVVNPLLT